MSSKRRMEHTGLTWLRRDGVEPRGADLAKVGLARFVHVHLLKSLASSRQRTLTLSHRFVAFFAVKVERTVVRPFGCSWMPMSKERENSTVLGCVALDLASFSQSSAARALLRCCVAFCPTSAFVNSALKTPEPVPQVTKMTGLDGGPFVRETWAELESMVLQRGFSRCTLFTPAMMIFLCGVVSFSQEQSPSVNTLKPLSFWAPRPMQPIAPTFMRACKPFGYVHANVRPAGLPTGHNYGR